MVRTKDDVRREGYWKEELKNVRKGGLVTETKNRDTVSNMV
jgi:hypothetical protein